MAGRPIFALLALILVAGGLLLNIFVILSGISLVNVKPINLVYFLSADTAGMGPGAPATSSWTYFSLCTLAGGVNTKCGSVKPAFPFDPAVNFGGSKGVPSAITDSTKFYYYMSRVSWSFYVIAAFFGACTLFFGIFACCTRVASFLSGTFAFFAMGAQAVCAALMTAWTVKARSAFNAAGHTSNLGRYGYGFTWASFVCYFLAMVFFCSGGGRKKKTTEEEEGAMDPATGQPVQQTSGGGGGGFFGRQSSSKSRENGVKDEYS